MRKLCNVIFILVCCFFLNGCENDCSHQYSISKTVPATCTEEGYNEYKCSVCDDVYTEVLTARGHVEGEAPTLDASQVCIACGTVLSGPVDYMTYRDSDLTINHYYGFNDDYITTPVVTQNPNRYEPDPIKYVDKNGSAYNLNLSIPIQDFFNHDVKSVSRITTSDGKTYSTNSGFKVAFTFTTYNKSVESIHAWSKGLSAEFTLLRRNIRMYPR